VRRSARSSEWIHPLGASLADQPDRILVDPLVGEHRERLEVADDSELGGSAIGRRHEMQVGDVMAIV